MDIESTLAIKLDFFLASDLQGSSRAVLDAFFGHLGQRLVHIAVERYVQFDIETSPDE
jgi:hypothetical protein